jgi:flavin reductase (DIM6/NTAB) family NADH-FMN oxidoreductase RutF
MLYISLRPERYSYNIIKESGEFAINLTTSALAYATDFCGVKSGRDIDKFEALGLEKQKANQIHISNRGSEISNQFILYDSLNLIHNTTPHFV